MKVVPTSCSFQYISQCSFFYKVNSKRKFTVNNKMVYFYTSSDAETWQCWWMMMHFNAFCMKTGRLFSLQQWSWQTKFIIWFFQLYRCHTVLTFTITRKKLLILKLQLLLITAQSLRIINGTGTSQRDDEKSRLIYGTYCDEADCVKSPMTKEADGDKQTAWCKRGNDEPWLPLARCMCFWQMKKDEWDR